EAGPAQKGDCSSALGLEDGHVYYGQLTSSSYRENNPADAARLNVVPNVMVMEPGWSPLPGDPHPYLQVDFLEPVWISGVVTQGSERMWGYLSKYTLAFALEESQFMNVTETGDARSPAKVFEVRMVGRKPVTRWLDHLIKARFLRIIPVEFRHTFYLRAEVLGCRGDEWVTVSSKMSSAPSGGPGVQNHTEPVGAPGVHTESPPEGEPGVISPSPTSVSVWTASTPHDDGLPRVLCVEGQFSCRTFGCVEAVLVCDGRDDCPDGSDEHGCGSLAPTPKGPPPHKRCSRKQFLCGSGECVSSERKCDLHKDCADGSDEQHCYDCILSAWSPWSQCSASCGLGSVYRQRSILRDSRPGGSCGGAHLCVCGLVDGHWTEWSSWSECDAPCSGGLMVRNRSCSNPPPKNNGRDCSGMSRQTHTCNTHPCSPSTDTQTGLCNISTLSISSLLSYETQI
ncbi:hypothetical protein DNTS_025544, partial [Danionella cerebrum]